MNTTLLQTEWEACPLPPARDRELEALARREYGMLPTYLPYLVYSPWVVRAQIRLSRYHGALTRLDFDIADRVSMIVSQENSCRFCFAVSRYLLRVQGLSEERIAELRAQLAQGTVEPRTAAAVAFARRMSRSQPLIGAVDRRRLSDAGFGDQEAREIAFVVASMCFANRVTTITAIPPFALERFPDRWIFKLLRPLMARMLVKRRRLGERALPPTPPGGFLAPLIQALGDSPIGAVLAETLDELWASPVLTRRCKALLFAVVATGLSCPHSVEQASRILQSEGLGDADIRHILTHLQSPALNEIENLLLPFARDTIWYQPSMVQRRARELSARLTPAQFVEAVGVLSLANALCRLAPAVLEP